MPNYTYKKKTREDLAKDNRTNFQKKFKLGSVRKAVLNVNPTAYNVIDDIMTSDDEAKRQPKKILHAAGKKASERGFVCEISFAGSEFTEFRAMHKHLPGKSAIQEDVHDKEHRITIKKPLKVHWWNRAFGKLPFVNSPEQIQRINDQIRIDNERVETALEERFGKRWINPKTGKEDKYIRVKDHNEKVHRISLPGPPGLRDHGERSINSLREKAFEISKAYLEDKLEKIKNGEIPPQPITVQLKGHSRGGVAAGETMQMITQWVNDKYPELKDLVEYNLMQYDPVPGYTSHHNHAKMDYDQKYVGDKQGKVKRGNSEPGKTNTTVFYSLQTAEDPAKNHFFDPQEIAGAKRIILCPMRHMIDLAEVDESQVTETNDTLYKPGYSLAENGNLVRGSGMSELDDGIYIIDENNTLVKLETPQQVVSVLRDVWKDTIQQADRQRIIADTIKTWFDRNLPSQKVEREDAVVELNNIIDTSLYFEDSSKDAIKVTDGKNSKAHLAEAIYLASLKENSNTIPVKELKEAIKFETIAKNVQAIMKSDAFKDIYMEAKGHTVSLSEAVERFETSKIKYPGKETKKLSLLDQVRENSQPELESSVSIN